MVSYWKSPKDPFMIFDAIARLKTTESFNLLVIGDGPQLEEMKLYVAKLNLLEKITFTGRKEGYFIANSLKSASYLIHCSTYETASVVCMEALCCGTPIIASDVGGISEYTHPKNSIMVSNNSVENWTKSLTDSLNQKWSNSEISLEASSKWNAETVGAKYFNAIING
jgi:glycosyltransferase involved in cell wall biosynthesis